jgi:acetolactate synthase-1/2/3 large subunit
MRVADYIANFLYNKGVDRIFMQVGGGSIYLDDGIACHSYIKEVGVRNEATAPMMAEAYARLKGGIGAVYVTTGPGGTNAVTGIAEAWVDSAPIIVISGQVEKKFTTFQSGLKGVRTLGCQELDIIEIVKSITKYATMVKDATSIKWHLEKAYHLATSGRPGPVWLDIPLDIQSSTIDEESLDSFTFKYSCPIIDDYIIDQVIHMIQHSNKPLIIIGQGVRQGNAISELKYLIERIKIPVISSRLGQDILPFSYKYYCGHGGTRGSKATAEIMKEADLIISLGSRLAISFVGPNLDAFDRNANIIAVDIERAELLKTGVQINLPIHGDVKDFLLKLNVKLFSCERPVILPTFSTWIDRCIDKKITKSLVHFRDESNPINLYHFISKIDELSNEKQIFVSDAGSSYFVSGQSLSFEKAKREITSGAFASMGLSIPLSIGCCSADDSIQVIAITGDGSLETNIQELKTLSMYNLDAKIFVINNGGYASIRNTQNQLCDGRYINSDQANANGILNFCKVADAFNIKYFLIDDYNKIETVFKKVTDFKGPAFIEVVCDNKQKIINCY